MWGRPTAIQLGSCCKYGLRTVLIFFFLTESTIYTKRFIPFCEHTCNTYLLLTEFEVRTVSYGPSFFPFASRLGHKSTGKKRGSVTYSTDRENEVSKIFIISLGLGGRTGKESFKFTGPYTGEYGPQN